MERISVGSTLATSARERRRVTLQDGSVLYVNERSRVVVESPRRLRLFGCEVFVEVVPAELLASSVCEPFTVATPDRRVTALGTKFAVSIRDAATGVVVAQGKVQVSGVEQQIEAGQQWSSPSLSKGEQGGATSIDARLGHNPPPRPPFVRGETSIPLCANPNHSPGLTI